MHTYLTHGQKWARNPLGREGENSRDFATFISGTAVCRDVPAKVYGTLSQRLAITGLLVVKGLLHQNMKSPVSPLPTTDIYHKDKINSSACVCVHTCMCIYNPWKPPTKGKLDRKQNIKTDKGRRKGSFPPMALAAQLPYRPQRKGSAYSESWVVCKALKALVYLSFF